MASKRRSKLLENPPPASSSEEEDSEKESEEEVNHEDEEEVEEAEVDEEEEKDDDEEEEEEDDDDDDDDDDEEEDEETIKSRFSVKKYVSTPNPHHQSSSDSGSDSENPNPKKPNTTVVFGKRPTSGEPSSNADKPEKRRKKSNDIVVVETEKKSSSQRLWSEEDEIVILKGMVSYAKKGLKPSADMNGFLESIKDSLHVDVSKDQVFNKIKRLKQKYQSNAQKERNGEELTFSKGHEKKSFELSKKVWGDNKDVKVEEMDVINGGVEQDAKKENGKASRKKKVSNGVVEVSKKPTLEANGKTDVPMVEEEVVKEEEKEFVLHTVNLNELMKPRKDSTRAPSGLGELVGVEVMQLIGGSKATELEQKWRDLQIAETKLYLERIELIREQTEVVLNALKSSKS